jgi:hypothetical protein
MQSVTAWLSEHVLDFRSLGAYLGAAIVVFLGMLAVGLLLMPGALRWFWRRLRRWWGGR